VPTISRFHGIVIRMFFEDHGFPHFHAEAAGRSAKVRIDQIEVIEGNLTRKQIKMVCQWATLHQSELEKNWQLARESGTLEQIEPWN
jgi:Domain of unknown function (DUF4160)